MVNLRYYLTTEWTKHLLTVVNLFFINLFPVITQLLILKILSTTITTSEFGLYTLLLTFNILITQIFSNGLISATARYFGSPNYNTEDFVSNYSSIFVFNLFIILIFSFLFCFIFYYFRGLAFSINLIIIIITSILDIFFQSYISLNNKINRRDRVLIYSFIFNLAKILGIAVVYFLNLLNVRSILIVYLIVTFLLDSILFITTYKKFPDINVILKNKNFKSEMFNYVKPFYLSGFFSFLFFVVDKWTIEIFLNEHYLGIYSIFYQIGYTPFTYLSLIITMFLSPIIFNKTDTNSSLDFISRDLLIPFFIFIIIVILSTYFLKDKIVLILLDKKYLDYSYYFIFMAISGSIYLFTQILNLFYLAKKQVYILTKIQIFGAFFSIFSLIFFMKFMPIYLLPISFIFTNLLILTLLYYFE